MNIFKKFFKKERALSVHDIFSQLNEALEEFFGDEYFYLDNIYVDNNGNNFAVVACEGKLFKVLYSAFNGEVDVTSVEQVEVEFTPVSRTHIVTRKVSDTESIWYGRVASAVLNRSAQIDTTKLFDYFEENYVENSAYLTLSHLPEKPFAFGKVKGVFRYNELLIGYGTIDTSTVLGQKAEQAIDSGEYGFSIAFLTDSGKEIEVDGIKIRTFEVGELKEISLLKENTAANLFTKAKYKERKEMQKERAFQVLKDFLNDEDEAKELLDEVEGISREIKDSNLITRDNEETITEEAEENTKMEFVITPEALETITRGVAEKVAEGFKDTFEAVTTLLKNQELRVAELENKLKKTEQGELDLPIQNRSKPVSRPTQKNDNPNIAILNINDMLAEKLASTKVK